MKFADLVPGTLIMNDPLYIAVAVMVEHRMCGTIGAVRIVWLRNNGTMSDLTYGSKGTTPPRWRCVP